MLKPLRGGRNQHTVKVTGTVTVSGVSAGATTAVQTVDYGDAYETMDGQAGIDEDGVLLAIWTDPRIAVVDGFEITVLAQWESGFSAQAKNIGGETADFVWDWLVRGILF
jgi:hypothetical protein